LSSQTKRSGQIRKAKARILNAELALKKPREVGEFPHWRQRRAEQKFRDEELIADLEGIDMSGQVAPDTAWAAIPPENGFARPRTGDAAVQNTKNRRAAVDAYIAEVLQKTGKRITRKDIWSRVGYKRRTVFECWERCDPKRPNKVADERFRAILREKPHLK
jgi:hypothetical protein